MSIPASDGPKKVRRGQRTKADPGLADRIYEARLRTNLTLREFAEKIGVTYETASRYETGAIAPSRERMKVIAKVLRVAVGTLLPAAPSVPLGSEQESAQGGDLNTRRSGGHAPNASSALDRLPNLLKWWSSYADDLIRQGFRFSDIRRIELGLLEIDNVRFRRDLSKDTRTSEEVRRHWLQVLPLLLADVRSDEKPIQVSQPRAKRTAR